LLGESLVGLSTHFTVIKNTFLRRNFDQYALKCFIFRKKLEKITSCYSHHLLRLVSRLRLQRKRVYYRKRTRLAIANVLFLRLCRLTSNSAVFVDGNEKVFFRSRDQDTLATPLLRHVRSHISKSC